MRSRLAVAVAAAAVLAGSVPAARAANQSHPSERANRTSIGIDRIDQRGNNVDRLYWYERTGAGVSIYIVDTGVNHLNNDFGGRVIPLFDFQRSPNDPSFGLGNDEHGTDVASQAGGRTYGVAKNATIYSVRVKDFTTGAGTVQDLINGLEAVRLHISDPNGARRPAVVNMSVIQPGCPSTSCTSVEAKVQQLVAAGAVVVTGTNNSSQSSFSVAPCRLGLASPSNGVICVAGTDAADDGFTFNDSLAQGSGTPFEILAPAGRPGSPSVAWFQHALSHNLVYGKGGFLNGNSMASPLVAGAVALRLEDFAGLPAAQQPSPGQIELDVLSNASPIFSGSMVYTGCEFLPPYLENPMLDTRRFVKQHYHDILGRQPDEAGWNFWAGQVNNDPNCTVDRWGCFGRVNTTRAFFDSIENLETNFFAYRLHRLTFPSFPKPEHAFSTRTNPRMERLLSEGRRIGRGVVVGAPNWNVILESNQRAFVNAWVASAEFQSLYPPGMNNSTFVQTLYANAQVPLDANGSSAVARLNNGEARGSVLFDLVKGPALSSDNPATHPDTVRNIWNPMYVLLGYLTFYRRNPDDPPNFNSLADFDARLGQLNHRTFDLGDPNTGRHELIRGFVTSPEYQKRFFDDPHCGQPPAPEEPPIDDPPHDPCGGGMLC